jgi:hypothetical protein
MEKVSRNLSPTEIAYRTITDFRNREPATGFRADYGCTLCKLAQALHLVCTVKATR